MKTSMMRTPLIKSAAVLLIFAILAYLTSASPDGGVLNSLGLMIIGVFRFIQWTIAMVIGMAVCIAFLIGIFLFAVSLVNRETAASMYAAVKMAVAELCRPLFVYISSLQSKDSQGVASPAAADELKEELQAIISGEVRKVTDCQQSLNDQFIPLNSKITELESKTSDYAAVAQLEAIAGEIAASGQVLTEVKDQVANLEGKLNESASKLEGLHPDKILGDIPTRLEKLEQQDNGFDPQPLTEAIDALKTEMEEVKKTGAAKTTKSPARSRKKA
jgi:hypothetical protein